MNELIEIRGDGMFPINARDLHERLEIGTAYKDWFPRMVEYGFEEGKDFNSLKNERVQTEGGRAVTRTVTEHHLSISMAKEICMIQRTEKGREVRRYLIAIENRWNSPEAVMSRALQMADKKLHELSMSVLLLEEKAAEDAPKVLFADSVATSDQSILIGELAKLMRQNGLEIGQNRLFERLRREGFLCSTGERRNLPTQRSMEQGLMEIKERTINNPDGTVRLTMTPKVTGKGQVYFVNKYREWSGERGKERIG